MIKKCASEYILDGESIEYDPRSGRLSTSTTQENIGKICDLINGDRRLNIREIADAVNFSYKQA